MKTIPDTQYLDTWDGDHPCDWLHLGNGLRLSLAAYACRANAFTRFPAGHPGVRLGPRALRAGPVQVQLEHQGTRLEIVVTRPSAECLRLRWRTLAHGEWGLRFWICLALHLPADDGGSAVWRHDPASGLTSAANRRGAVAVLGERPPLMATFHEHIEALAEEFHTYGYWYLASRGREGPLAVLRYNLEEMPAFSVALACAADPAGAERDVGAALADDHEQRPETLHEGRHGGALDAVRDVMGWNTVYDAVNQRPYTCLSRAWGPARFGGFGVWLDDVFLHALMAGTLDARLADWNLEAVLAGATRAGNLPCLLTGRDAWVDRSQPPIGSFVSWMLYLRHGDRRLLERCFPVLLANHRWWWSARDGNRNGLLEYGTSPVGDGLYRGTALAARDESMMDNSPMHDEARLDPASWTLDCEDVGLNSLLVLDAEMLAEMAATLGDPVLAGQLTAQARAHAGRIAEHLFDESRGVFANRLWNGRFVRSITPTSFLPLLADAASPAQVAAMLAALDDPRRFGGEWLLPSVSRDDPAFHDNVYWRGRIWPPLNFLVWHGLRRRGHHRQASRLADNSANLFMREWHAHRYSPENFNADSGAAGDQPDTDLFYGWGALMPWLAVAEICDVDPWAGWNVTHDGEDFALGPLPVPDGTARLRCESGVLGIELPDRPRLRTNWRGHWRELRIRAERMEARLPRRAAADRWLSLEAVPDGSVPSLTLDDGPPVACPTRDGRLILDAASLPPGARLVVAWR